MKIEGNNKLDSMSSLIATIPSNNTKNLKLTRIKINSSMRKTCANMLIRNSFERFIENKRAYKM